MVFSMNSPEHMRVVVESLQNDPSIVIAGGIETMHYRTNRAPEAHNYSVRKLEIYTYPVDPLYTDTELNDAMKQLVPELEPTETVEFFKGDKSMKLGRLSYIENVGTLVLNSTVRINIDNSMVTTRRLSSIWENSETHQLTQKTQVLVFPDEAHAIDAAHRRHKHEIPLKKLGNISLDTFPEQHQPEILKASK